MVEDLKRLTKNDRSNVTKRKGTQRPFLINLDLLTNLNLIQNETVLTKYSTQCTFPYIIYKIRVTSRSVFSFYESLTWYVTKVPCRVFYKGTTITCWVVVSRVRDQTDRGYPQNNGIFRLQRCRSFTNLTRKRGRFTCFFTCRGTSLLINDVDESLQRF